MNSSYITPKTTIVFGIVVGLLASFIQSLGLTIQRKSHVINQSLPDHLQRVEHRRPLWLFGFAIFIFSNVFGSLFQIASLPVVILAPLGAVSLLWNALFARILLGDIFSMWMIIGTFVIAGGAVLIGIFGIVPEPTHSLEDLLELLVRPTFVVYFSMLCFTVIIGLIITHIVEYSISRRFCSRCLDLPASPHGPLNVLAGPDQAALEICTEPNERTSLLEQKLYKFPGAKLPVPAESAAVVNRAYTLLALSYASASGTLSGMCLLFAKSGVELLLLTIGGQNQFWRWESWALLLGLVTLALLQLWYMHKGLTFADPTIVCPLAFCFYNTSSIINGLVYFDQFSVMTTQQLLLVSLGVAFLLGGVWMVSFHGGGGIAEVATWQEDEESAENRSNTQYTLGVGEISISPDLVQGSSSVPISTPPLEQSLSEPIELGTDQSVRWTKQRQQTQSLRRHRRSFLQQSESHIPGGGFSIGLSPMSPGFTLIPKRRASHDAGNLALRRAVSEGNAYYDDDGYTNDAVLEERNVTKPKVARNKWKWLRNMFLDHRDEP